MIPSKRQADSNAESTHYAAWTRRIDWMPRRGLQCVHSIWHARALESISQRHGSPSNPGRGQDSGTMLASMWLARQ
jgi:hypothetical protein